MEAWSHARDGDMSITMLQQMSASYYTCMQREKNTRKRDQLKKDKRDFYIKNGSPEVGEISKELLGYALQLVVINVQRLKHVFILQIVEFLGTSFQI